MSSLETEIKNLTAQASKLCDTFENKISEIDNAVIDAQKEFEQFQTTAGATYTNKKPLGFRVGGSIDKFYPVYLPTPLGHGLSRLNVWRGVSADSTWRGATLMQIITHTPNWGAWPATGILDVLRLHTSSQSPEVIRTDGFIGGFTQPYILAGTFVWLRGDCTYTVLNEHAEYIGVKEYTSIITRRTDLVDYMGVSIMLEGCNITDSGNTQHSLPITTRDTVTIPSLNYTRGA